MVLVTCCVIILITYILIFGLLTYYFIKKRSIWNELFSYDSIINILIEIFVCPEHFIIYIPGIVFENTSCVIKNTQNSNKEKIRIILTKINKILNKISEIDNENSRIKQVKWILDGTLENFNTMYEETAEFYNNLSGSYKVLNENTNNKINSNLQNTQNLVTLENLVLLEQNIEYCDSILELLDIIDYKDSTDFNIFIINNKYMICLIYNLIESIRLYKIRMCEIINI